MIGWWWGAYLFPLGASGQQGDECFGYADARGEGCGRGDEFRGAVFEEVEGGDEGGAVEA